ncbi:hypothetical protein MAE02_25570 [Microvirga aerophila]|uniref:Uncharacterized protein n=1 Tax=Microvirga aerophila TaxID=670291 RepID=A0A512BSD4_9HYPH|nr:hypothetical protein MAE02_25570 [Microvirga aerophila]
MAVADGRAGDTDVDMAGQKVIEQFAGRTDSNIQRDVRRERSELPDGWNKPGLRIGDAIIGNANAHFSDNHVPGEVQFVANCLQGVACSDRRPQCNAAEFRELEARGAPVTQARAQARFKGLDMSTDRRALHPQFCFRSGQSACFGYSSKNT